MDHTPSRTLLLKRFKKGLGGKRDEIDIHLPDGFGLTFKKYIKLSMPHHSSSQESLPFNGCLWAGSDH
jgi:hypothetical protein